MAIFLNTNNLLSLSPVPMFNNHHTMQKIGFGKYKHLDHGNLYLPKIKSGNRGRHNNESLDYGHPNEKLIPLPSNSSSSNNKRYYVTFTLKDSQNNKENFSEDDKT